MGSTSVLVIGEDPIRQMDEFREPHWRWETFHELLRRDPGDPSSWQRYRAQPAIRATSALVEV